MLGGWVALAPPHHAVAAEPEVEVAGDPAAGEMVFKRCAVCHRIGDGAEAMPGPPLTGVVGRPAGALPGFEYSDAMRGAGGGGLIWTEENLFRFLADPVAFVPGTRMSFAGLRRDRQRTDLIAFLKTFP